MPPPIRLLQWHPSRLFRDAAVSGPGSIPLVSCPQPTPPSTSTPPSDGPGPLLKICLQVLVCLTLIFRGLVLFNQLRRLWQQEATSLAGEFHAELRRRGLLLPLPRYQEPC